VKVICNSTPLIALSSINRLQLLHDLFGEIIIPEKVYSEVVIAGSGKYGSVDVKVCPWISVVRTSNYSLKNILMQSGNSLPECRGPIYRARRGGIIEISHGKTY
jgi:predicted nucleic acid-binding protein